MATRKKRKTACSPAIWKKFSADEKRAWRVSYRDFAAQIRIDMEKRISVKDRNMLAHNMACLAIWRIESALKHKARKAAKAVRA